MISEGRMEHLEKLAEKIEAYEKQEPRWDWNKNLYAGSFSILIFGIGLFFTMFFSHVSSYILYIFAWGINLASLIVFIISFLNLRQQNENGKNFHQSYAKDIKDIIRKVKESLQD